MTTSNLALTFHRSALARPEAPALYWGEREYQYAELHDLVQRTAPFVGSGLGVKPGQRVALWLKNCPEFIPSYLGILWVGGVVVPINNFLKPDEVSYILRDSGAEVLITDQTTSEAWPKIKESVPGLKIWAVEDMASLPAVKCDPTHDRDRNELAVIIYTSGTTGRPKGAMLSHGNVLSNLESCRQVLMAVDSDRFVVLLPLFHSFMMTVGMLLPLAVGGSMVLIRSLHPPKNILQEIMLRSGTILPAIPQFFRTLAHAGVPPGFPVRLCISGAAPLPKEVLREFQEKTGLNLIEGYGLSEASPVVSLNPILGLKKEGSIGVPIPDVEMSVQNDEGVMLGVGETGEICVRGPNVMLGYWNQPKETSAALHQGWLRTGDVGHRDADGYYYITDRKKDMLLVNGINVYPREIEEAIYHYPGVKEVAVVGVQDPRRGEMPVAFVVPMEGGKVDEKMLVAFLKEKLADYKVPKKVILVEMLPKNATGKVLKTVLRQNPL